LWALERDRDFTSKIFFCCVVSRGDKKFSLEKFSCEDLVICIYLRSFLLCLLQHLTSEEATSETMPFCDVGEYASDVDGAGIDMKTGLEEGCSVQLYYQLFGHGPTKVLLIPGVAATYEAWGPQLLALCGTVESNEEETKRRSGRRDFMPHCVHDDDAITELARRRKSSECETATACGNGVQVCGGSFDGAFDDENRAAAAAAASSGTGVQVCAFDNRGVGRSSAPKRKKSYT
jgi:hypothetical protein